jgi:serine/threonine protein kinase
MSSSENAANDPMRTTDQANRPTLTLPPALGDDPVPEKIPQQIGRYVVERVLGKGAFGKVYLARDPLLERPVAIKVPHPHLISRPEDVAAYLAEARILATLEHPHITPVFDVGTTEEGLCFVVSKLIEGTDLARRIQQGCPSFPESAQWVAAIAQALHHAHGKRLVHRDVKPSNILLDANGKPYLADFGLALREEDFGIAARLAGTPAYMSPEQARGEGHRVDGRSDVYSLGVVLYELLTGRRPFHGETVAEVLDQIVVLEPRPPRQINDRIPLEMERVCLKALAKTPGERYSTARDLAEDLQRVLEGIRGNIPAGNPGQEAKKGIFFEARFGNFGCSLSIVILLAVLVLGPLSLHLGENANNTFSYVSTKIGGTGGGKIVAPSQTGVPLQTGVPPRTGVASGLSLAVVALLVLGALGVLVWLWHTQRVRGKVVLWFLIAVLLGVLGLSVARLFGWTLP